MSEFNFKSQICTTKEQSERLLSLGLKKETADMCWIPLNDGRCVIGISAEIKLDIIPAWSLHRLLCLIPGEVTIDGYTFPLRKDILCMLATKDDDIYQAIVDVVTRSIELGYINKEYLV